MNNEEWTVREPEIRNEMSALFWPLATKCLRGQCMCSNTLDNARCAAAMTSQHLRPRALTLAPESWHPLSVWYDRTAMQAVRMQCYPRCSTCWRKGERRSSLSLLWNRAGAGAGSRSCGKTDAFAQFLKVLWYLTPPEKKKVRGRCVSQCESMSQMVTIVKCVRSMGWEEEEKTQRLFFFFFWGGEQGKKQPEWVFWDPGWYELNVCWQDLEVILWQYQHLGGDKSFVQMDQSERGQRECGAGVNPTWCPALLDVEWNCMY